MRTGIKSKVVFALTIALILTLSGCVLLNTTVNFTGETVEGNPLKYSFNAKDEAKLKTLMQECDELLAAGTNIKSLRKKINSAVTLANELEDAKDKAKLKYMIYGDEEIRAESDRLSALKVDFNQWHNDILHELAEGPYRGDFFAGMTDEEIESVIGTKRSEEYYAYQKEMDETQSEFISLDPTASDYYDKVDALYVKFVKVAQNFARSAGYDNYLEYAYANVYYRDYKPDDTEAFYNNVMKYVVPADKKKISEVYDIYRALSPEDKETVDDFFTGDGFINGFDKFTAYKNAIGGEMAKAYRHLWRRGGNYYISYEDKSYGTAFTNSFPNTGEPYLYFGKGHHQILTIAHEFGHYFADYSGSFVQCYDLCETQSQSDELLFVQFVKNQGYYNDATMKMIENYRVSNAYSTVIMCTLVNELERKVYADDDLTIGETDQYVDEIMEGKSELADDFDLKRYWRIVAIDSPAYYISYATSMIGALNVYEIAREDFDSGASTYLKLISYPSTCTTFGAVYDYAGLKNPLAEETFAYIFNR